MDTTIYAIAFALSALALFVSAAVLATALVVAC